MSRDIMILIKKKYVNSKLKTYFLFYFYVYFNCISSRGSVSVGICFLTSVDHRLHTHAQYPRKIFKLSSEPRKRKKNEKINKGKFQVPKSMSRFDFFSISSIMTEKIVRSTEKKTPNPFLLFMNKLKKKTSFYFKYYKVPSNSFKHLFFLLLKWYSAQL